MAPGPFSILAPFIGVRKSKKYEKLQTEDPEKKKQEATQEEINRLHTKIDKLVATMSREDLDLAGCPEDACAVCCQSRSVMQVAPCGHQALCRLCFVRNIQEAVASRDLPLKCLICGTKIIRVKNNARGGHGTEHPVHVGIGATRNNKPPRSVSGYSLCATSDVEAEAGNISRPVNSSRHPSLAQSASSYSMSSAFSSMSTSSFESGRSVKSVTSMRSNVSQKSNASNNSWFSIGSLSNFQASRLMDSKAMNKPPRAHSLSSRGKNRPRSNASSSSSTLTASSSDTSIKRHITPASNSSNNNNNNSPPPSTVTTPASIVVTSPSREDVREIDLMGDHPYGLMPAAAGGNPVGGGGLYKEPRLNKSDSTGLASTSQNGLLNSHVPLSPNSIDNRLRAIQISLSNERLNGNTTANGYNSNGNGPGVAVPISQRRRESFRQQHQRNLGCVAPESKSSAGGGGGVQNLNIDNCYVLKSQLRRLSGSGKDGQFGRARYTKSPELIETTFSMSTIEEEQEIALSLKNLDS